MMRTLRYLAFISCLIFLCQCSVNVPASDIPASAWRPGDIGVAKKTIYIDKEGSDLSLGTNPNYNHIGTLKPGDRVQITRCYRYLLTTVGGTHLDAVILDGEFAGTKVWMSTLGNKYDFIYLMPDPEIVARVD